MQHGDGDDPDGLSALLNRAGAPDGPAADEGRWVARFLNVRLRTLRHAADPATRRAWAESTDRVRVQQAWLHDGRYRLDGPLPVEAASFHHVLP